MDRTETKALLAACADYSNRYNEIEPVVYEAVGRRKTLTRVIDQLVHLEKDPKNQFPEGFYTQLTGSFALSQLLTGADSTEKFLKAYRSELSPEAVDTIELWIETPLRWTFFTIRREHEDDLFTITDGLAGEEMLLYSPGLRRMQGMGSSRDCSYLTLLFWNTTCWQTAGMLHYYHLTAENIVFFCTGLDADLYAEKGLSGIINGHFIDFFRLDNISTLPPTMYRGEPVAMYWKELHLEGVATKKLPGKWDATTGKDSLVHLSYRGPDSWLTVNTPVPSQFLRGRTTAEFWTADGMKFPELYIDMKTERIGLSALTRSGFDLLTCLLASLFPQIDPFACNPDWTVSVQMQVVYEKIPGFTLPWAALKVPFDESSSKRKDSSRDERAEDGSNGHSMQATNTLLSEYIASLNTGVPFDAERRCRELGVDIEDFNSIAGSFQNMMQKNIPPLELSEEDRALAIDYPVPPPSVRRSFTNDLDTSTLFTVLDDDESYADFHAMTGGSRTQEVEAWELGAYITGLFANAFNRKDGITIMNSFFYLLVHTGERPISVRAYALEILKLFGHVLLPSLETDVDGFVATFSRFVLRRLCTNALCEVDAKPTREQVANGTYTIRSTVFFEDLINLADGDGDAHGGTSED